MKTDRNGMVVKQIGMGYHHSDLCFHDGIRGDNRYLLVSYLSGAPFPPELLPLNVDRVANASMVPAGNGPRPKSSPQYK